LTAAYNADGLRVRKESAAGLVKFIWDQQNYLKETDGSNVTQVTYTTKPEQYGKVISQRRENA
jgi:hypothetical protein